MCQGMLGPGTVRAGGAAHLILALPPRPALLPATAAQKPQPGAGRGRESFDLPARAVLYAAHPAGCVASHPAMPVCVLTWHGAVRTARG